MLADSGPPFVSVVMPTRNEAAHIDAALDAIDAQAYPRDRIEVIVVDGGSVDDTMARVEARAGRDGRIRLIGGPGVNTPAAMNVGLAAARGGLIAKIDGHGTTNSDFLQVATTALAANDALGCVGGRVVPEATTAVEQGIAHARFSVLGVGAGVYTLSERPQLTDTVQCGVYRRSALEAVGAFDAALAFGEDEELNHRLRQAGWQILMDPRMRFTYRVRPSLAALFRQYFRYGRARVAVIRKHPSFFRPKHAIPALVVIALVATLPLVVLPGSRWPAIVAWLGYGAFILGGGLFLALRHRFARPELIAASLAALHAGYGLGTLRGLFDRRHAPIDARARTGSTVDRGD